MKTFIKKISLLFFFSFSLFFLLKITLKKHQHKNYTSAFVDKLKLLQQNKSQRKIILLGGSAVGFGLSAEQIERTLGIKTINLGLNFAIGLTDFQPFLMKNITKEDIIVFSPEWEFYSQPTFHAVADLENLIRNNYEYGKLMEKEEYVIKSYFSKIQLSLLYGENKNTPYRYNCMNAFGDIISHCSLPAPGAKNYTINTTSLQTEAFPKYFPFIDSNKTVFLFPPTQERIYNKYKAYFSNIQQSLLNQHYMLADSVVNNVYPLSDFFDGDYHIKCEARVRRTEKLIAYLQQVIKGPAALQRHLSQ